jgi:hypothetical protein
MIKRLWRRIFGKKVVKPRLSEDKMRTQAVWIMKSNEKKGLGSWKFKK